MRIIAWPGSEDDDDLAPKYDPRTSIVDEGDITSDALIAIDEALKEAQSWNWCYTTQTRSVAFYIDQRVAP